MQVRPVLRKTALLGFGFVAIVTVILAGCGGSGGVGENNAKGGNSASSQNASPLFAGVSFVTASDTTALTVAWLDAQDDTTPPSQIKYNIYVSIDPNFTPSDATLVKTVTGETQALITGLTAGATYYIQVAAVDKEGLTSTTSNLAASATTLTSPIVLSATTPLGKAADFHLVSPTVTGDDYHYPYTGVETLPPVGSILIGADASGDGYLVKVISASISGDEIVVHTAPGELSDAVVQGEINSTFRLFDNPGSQNSAASAAASLRSSSDVSVTQDRPKKLLTFQESAVTNLPPGFSVRRDLQTGHYLITDTQNNGVSLSSNNRELTGSASETLSYDVGITLSYSRKWCTGKFSMMG